MNQAAITKELDLIHDLFGSDLDLAIVDSGNDKDGAKCQQGAAKQVKKCQDAKLKAFNACKKDGLKDATVHDALTLADCMGQDPKGGIEKDCVTKLTDKVGKSCTGLDYATLFPGECSGEATLADFESCLEARVECRVCLALNEADNLARDCDEFDDGAFNASCP